MPRVKRSVNAKKKRREVLEQASGYWGLKSKVYQRAKEQVMRSGNYAFRDRKARKRDFRKLWIIRINAGARAARHLVLAADARPARAEIDDRPQDPGRPRRRRARRRSPPIAEKAKAALAAD